MSCSWLRPKVELHCHLLGVITPALLEQIRRQGGATLVQPEALAEVHPVSDLESFRRWLEVLKPYQSAPAELMRPVLEAHAAHLLAQNVLYAEVMLSPAMFPRERPSDLLEAFHRWRQWALSLEHNRLQMEFILVIPRTLAAEKLQSEVASFIELHRQGLIVGVALVGVETGESIQKFASSFQRLREAGLGIEIHAGEHSGPHSVRDALEYGKPHRLGHALSAFQDPALLEQIHRDQVHLEFCLTSNLRTGAIRHIHQHPIRCARDRGLSFSINTDDPGAFASSLAHEYELAAQAFHFDNEDFDAILRHSLAARFQPRLRYLKSDNQGELTPPAYRS